MVIELLSDSTAAQDKGEKKAIYQDRLRVPEYFWFDLFSGEWAGFSLRCGEYQAIAEDVQGRKVLGLTQERHDKPFVWGPQVKSLINDSRVYGK